MCKQPIVTVIMLCTAGLDLPIHFAFASLVEVVNLQEQATQSNDVNVEAV